MFSRRRQCCFSPKVLLHLFLVFSPSSLHSLVLSAFLPPLALQPLSSVSFSFFHIPFSLPQLSTTLSALRVPRLSTLLSSSQNAHHVDECHHDPSTRGRFLFSFCHCPPTSASVSAVGSSATFSCVLLATLLSAPLPALYHCSSCSVYTYSCSFIHPVDTSSLSMAETPAHRLDLRVGGKYRLGKKIGSGSFGAWLPFVRSRAF